MRWIMILLLSLSWAYAREASPPLTRENAQMRSKQVQNPRYQIHFDIDDTAKEYSGTMKVAFTFTPNQKALFLDFAQGTVHGVTLNGHQIDYQYDKAFITIAQDLLPAGEHLLEVQFSHEYSDDGDGFYRFKDPEDGKVYTYTNFEPYDANRLFPCFDQPDLKGIYTVTVDAPASWEVITSTLANKVEHSKQGRKLWHFPASAKFSTYLFSLHAGPYHVWKDQHGKTPLRLFARESLAKYVRPKDWFTFTKQGLDYFPKIFGYPYPFKKYDQVIVPDFTSGAMENVAAVTFNERFIVRGKPTEQDREGLAWTLLHEMAHMWFGNLVTMDWWNGLWLNESFATVTSTYALHEVTEFKKAWLSFQIGEKQWALTEDQYPTTHPIEAIIPTTDAAFTNFDGITYGKGASVLKQLFYRLGRKNWQAGLKHYFHRHAFGNATLKDFITALEEKSGPLKDWTPVWLETAGPNTVKAQWSCEDNRISKFELLQSAPKEWPTLRPHSTEVAFYKKDGKTYKSLKVNYQDAITEVSRAKGLPCPAFVNPNHNDEDYAKWHLDETSLTFVKENLASLRDPLTRMQVWFALWEQVRDGELAAPAYADILLKQITDKETEYKIVDQALNSAHGGRYSNSTLLTYLGQQDPRRAQLESHMWTHLQKQKAGTDLQKRWFIAYAFMAHTPEHIDKVAHYLLGKLPIKGMELDQDRRWAIVRQVNRYNAKLGEEVLVAELKKDPSSSGEKAAISAQAIRPEINNKHKWLKMVLSSSQEINWADRKAAGRYLFTPEQSQVRYQMRNDLWKALEKSTKQSIDHQSMAGYSLVPLFCTDEGNQKMGRWIKQNDGDYPVLIKALKISHYEDGLCIRAKQKALTTTETL